MLYVVGYLQSRKNKDRLNKKSHGYICSKVER